MLIRLMFVLHMVIATTLIGVLITAAITTGYGTGRPILLAALLGFVAALPVSWSVARRIIR